MKVLYNDLSTGVPLAPSGQIFPWMWLFLYISMVVHAICHFIRRNKYQMYNWSVHSLLILYQLTLLFWPMVFASRHLWLAFGMVAFAGCIIRSVSVSASKNGYYTDRWWHWVCSDLLNVQTTWLALAALVAFSLALKDNISTIKLGDDWAALGIAGFTVITGGLALYTATTLGLLAGILSLLAILLRSAGTYSGPDTGLFDIGMNRLTNGFSIAGMCVLFLTFVPVIYMRVSGERSGNFGGKYGKVRSRAAALEDTTYEQ
jgi:tryptophan-rich sensory protein